MKYSIGDVSILRHGTVTSIMGDERVAVLQHFYLTRRVKDGYSAVTWNPRRRVKWADVNWETAGVAITNPR